ncbi:MAG: hemagglutinin repeat-containing protein [Arcobacter sp.]|uniref:hemagglutinin repeat-containing protein n=1 Tax=Arcobacter sp. TaxID=1872629 RepID=UPI003D024676
MEEKIVDNKKVLVPVVYLAIINLKNMTDGAKIVADNYLSITAKNDVTNQGLLSSNRNTNIQASNITNQGGTINSAKDISLNATNNIDNISGNIKAANDVNLIAKNDINIKTAQIEKNYNYGSGYENVTTKGQTSTIQAGGNVTADAGNSVTLTGAKIDANKDVLLTASNGKVAIDSIETNSDYNFNLHNG